ncbi:hypothetical protein F444_20144 [Phytophthora nicotianae P1976]|uniref:Uncharacterized protein n=1 Tax=Phytophthora nicotianae P1976 TaxID=1317066 RepID=A0A080Z5K5_PHYNI|nr:hypothetical protein F444_20144 [Phytophthora nicotianae P1976]
MAILGQHSLQQKWKRRSVLWRVEAVQPTLSLWKVQYNAGMHKKRKQDETEDYQDYHGNFNSELFEAWFENLCKLLRDQYGGCNIHMDGAGYHKRLTNEMPTTRSLRSWLEDHLNKVGGMSTNLDQS